jgi:hypothetical protein
MKYSFLKGMSEIRKKDLPKIKKEIKDALFIFNDTTWYKRINGKIEPKVSEYEAIETIFLKYGVTEIWGVA